jgi:hypothetical protein
LIERYVLDAVQSRIAINDLNDAKGNLIRRSTVFLRQLQLWQRRPDKRGNPGKREAKDQKQDVTAEPFAEISCKEGGRGKRQKQKEAKGKRNKRKKNAGEHCANR